MNSPSVPYCRELTYWGDPFEVGQKFSWPSFFLQASLPFWHTLPYNMRLGRRDALTKSPLYRSSSGMVVFLTSQHKDCRILWSLGALTYPHSVLFVLYLISVGWESQALFLATWGFILNKYSKKNWAKGCLLHMFNSRTPCWSWSGLWSRDFIGSSVFSVLGQAPKTNTQNSLDTVVHAFLEGISL